jgi:hypothetical protein
METITALYDIAFSYFYHRVSGVFIIYIFRFFPLCFLKIIFILCEVQALKGDITIHMCVYLTLERSWQPSGWQLPHRCVARRALR